MVDVPPQDALLTLDAAGLVEGTSHGVVLTRKAADDHIDVGNLGLPRLGLLQNPVDVLVHHGAIAEAFGVAAGGELAGLGSRRFPLVRPDGGKRPCGLHIELGMLGVREALEAQAKPADAREELGDLDFRHVSPIAAVSVLA